MTNYEEPVYEETVIIVSGSGSDWERLAGLCKGRISDFLCVDVPAKTITAPVINGIGKADFFIIHENAVNISKLIGTVLEKNSGRNIYVAVHDSESPLFPKLNEIKACLQAASSDINPIRFYHEKSDEFWEVGLKSFVDAVVTSVDVNSGLSKLLESIKELSKEAGKDIVVEKARLLRHEILSVFFRFNLESELIVKHAEEKEKRIGEIKSKIVYGNLDKKLNELLILKHAGKVVSQVKELDEFRRLKEKYINCQFSNSEQLLEEYKQFAGSINKLVEDIEELNQSAKP